MQLIFISKIRWLLKLRLQLRGQDTCTVPPEESSQNGAHELGWENIPQMFLLLIKLLCYPIKWLLVKDNVFIAVQCPNLVGLNVPWGASTMFNFEAIVGVGGRINEILW